MGRYGQYTGNFLLNFSERFWEDFFLQTSGKKSSVLDVGVIVVMVIIKQAPLRIRQQSNFGPAVSENANCLREVKEEENLSQPLLLRETRISFKIKFEIKTFSAKLNPRNPTTNIFSLKEL